MAYGSCAPRRCSSRPLLGSRRAARPPRRSAPRSPRRRARGRRSSSSPRRWCPTTRTSRSSSRRPRWARSTCASTKRRSRVPGPDRRRGRGRGARGRGGGRAGRQRARPRLALQRAAGVRRRRRAGAAPPQDHADLPRADDLGPGRRRRAARRRHAGRAHRRARVLGALQPARALRADGRPRGDPRGDVPGLAGRADLRRADRGHDPPPRARVGLLRRQRDRLADARAARRGRRARRGLERAVSGGCFTAIVSPEGVAARQAAHGGRGHRVRRPRPGADHQAQTHDGQRRALQPARAAAACWSIARRRAVVERARPRAPAAGRSLDVPVDAA